MKKLFINREIKYTGEQLSPHWIYRNFKLQGDAVVAFVGEVEVNLAELVDIEDVLNKEPIFSNSMLNFIVEIFETPLTKMVLIQRLLICIVKETLEDLGINVKRNGDDLFYNDKKLSVSIATKSITSSLIHTALNIVKEGAPIEVSCLEDMGISDVKTFADIILHKFVNEMKDIKLAAAKVRGVVA